ncbi:MAG: hypothetical protein F6K28_52785 [Microcoleus sp. SIO2G3]|nr:hypothetical protein [Microcoleus sp. SIO2G3]
MTSTARSRSLREALCSRKGELELQILLLTDETFATLELFFGSIGRC